MAKIWSTSAMGGSYELPNGIAPGESMADIELYYVFGTVVKAGSFSAAAKQVGVSNSHISKQIARLEKSLQVRLFQPMQRRNQLTDAGKSLLADTEILLADYKQLQQTAESIHAEPSGPVRVVLPPLLAKIYLLPRLPAFLKQFPKLQLEFTLEQATLQAFSKNVDMAITLGSLPDSSLMSKRIGELGASLVATPAYLRANRVPQRPADLMQLNCLVTYYETIGDMHEWVFVKDQQSIPVTVRGNVRVNDHQMIEELVLSHVGISMLADYFTKDRLQSGELVRLLPDYETPIKTPVYMVYHDRKLTVSKLQVVHDFVIGCFDN